MRRIVDTLILVLVAYSVCWPVARSFVADDSNAQQVVVLAARVPNCDTVPQATVRAARSESEACAGVWFAEATQPAGGEGAAFDALAGLSAVWVAIELPAVTLPPREVPLIDGTAAIEIATPTELRAVTGRVATPGSRVRVTVRTDSEPFAFDVPCDASGRFVFVLPPGDETPIALHGERGQLLVDGVIPGVVGLHDLGMLED